jgi:hypothetical protein
MFRNTTQMIGWEYSTLMFTPDVAPWPKASWTAPDGTTTSYNRSQGSAVLAALKARGWQVYTLIELVGQARGYRLYRMRRLAA